MSTVFDFAELESSSEAPAEDVRSHLMKAHSGLAAAIARVLAGEQEIVTDTIVPSSKVDKPTKPVKRKRSHVQSTSAKSIGSDEESSKVGQPSKCQSEVVKLAYLSVGDYPVNEERKLQRLATRGGTAKDHIPMGNVVQLFNAVSKHQKSIEDKLKEVGPSERKKHKVLSSVDKGAFIDMLKGAGKTGDDDDTDDAKATEPAWSILRDDYLKTNSKLQDWDKDSDSISGHSNNEED